MFGHLRLSRPLVFLDVETTGVDPRTDSIIEIAMMRFAPELTPVALEQRLNPQRLIPPAATAVHGMGDQHVMQSPTFAEQAADVARFIGDADLAGFGIARFDLPFLVAEFERIGWQFPLTGRKVIDALTLFHRLEPRDLAAAVRKYCGYELAHAH